MNIQKLRSTSFFLLKSYWHLGLIFVTILLFYFLGSYYENETDIFFLIYAKGLLTAKPLALPETFILQIFIGDVIASLYTYFPSFEWYDCLTLSFTFFIGAFLFNIYGFLKKSLINNLPLRIAVFFLFVAIFVSVTLLPEITRHSFLIIILAFVVIHFKLLYPEKVSSFFLIACYTVFLLSTLRRPEPAMALTFLFSFYQLLLSFEDRVRIKRVIKTIFPCLCILFSVFVYTHIPRTPEGHRYLRIVPYENTLVDFKGNFSDVYLSSKKDTVKYNAASHFFFCDTKHLNENFFQKIGIVPLDKSPFYFFDYVKRTSIIKDRFTKLIHDIVKNENGLFLLSIFINSLWLFAGLNSIKGCKGKLLFSIVFWFTFLFTNLFMKIETKVNESLLLFFTIMLLTYLINFELENLNRRILFALSISIIACITWRGCGCYELYQIRKNDALYVDRVRQTVNGLSKSLVVFNISCWDNISIRLFDQDHYNPDNTYISFDNGVLYLYDEYIHHTQDITGRSEFIDQIDFVIHQTNAYWFSSEARIKMIIDYLNTIYERKYEYTLVKEISRDKSRRFQTQLIGVYKLTVEREPI